MPPRVLILGGTAEGRELAARLHEDGAFVTTSLAGRTEDPQPLAGAVRTGGFGGVDGLSAWLREEAPDAVVDATHPFATRISGAAREACARTAVPLLRLERPAWSPRTGDRWTWAASLPEAAARVDELGTRVLLSTGRQGVGAFSGVRAWALVRCLRQPDEPLPRASQVLLDRGPFTPAGERALLEAHAIDLVVTKDSGGEATRAKLDAARALELPVLLVARAAEGEGHRVADVGQAASWAMMQR